MFCDDTIKALIVIWMIGFKWDLSGGRHFAVLKTLEHTVW